MNERDATIAAALQALLPRTWRVERVETTRRPAGWSLELRQLRSDRELRVVIRAPTVDVGRAAIERLIGLAGVADALPDEADVTVMIGRGGSATGDRRNRTRDSQ
jgi:hypothetical protein